MNKLWLSFGAAVQLALWSVGLAAAQEVFELNSKAQWDTWTFPRDIVAIDDDGTIRPVKFDQPINAALNATRFTHKLKEGGEAQGGVWKIGSGQATADLVIDGDPSTYWQPDQNAPLEDWWLEINLGRVVPVTSIRLTFPDAEGARPLQEFRVFAADGDREPKNQDVFQFHLVGGTTKRNAATTVEYKASSRFRKANFKWIDFSVQDKVTFETDFDPMQFIRIRVDAKSPNAALAEVEIFSYGENVALGTIERGGSIVDKNNRASEMSDGDVNTNWAVFNPQEGEIPEWVWDLGAVFWVNRFILLAEQTADTWFKPSIEDHRILTSDGTLKPTGEPNFNILFDFQGRNWPRPEELTYLLAPPMPIRFFNAVYTGRGITGAVSEFIVMPIGYPARFEMVSDFIRISDRPQVLQRLRWDADLPPHTRIEAQTRSGNRLAEEYTYYKKSGSLTTKKAWEKLPKAARGKVDTTLAPGDDWSAWSNVYQFSGQEFLSPSPRRFVQFRVIFNADTPDAAPTLRSLALDYTSAFISEVLGDIHPKEATPGAPQMFTYLLTPVEGEGDVGFNRILLETPSQANATSLAVRVGGQQIEPTAVEIMADSLIIELPNSVSQEPVEVDFEVTVVQNPYLFVAAVGNTDQPELWQVGEPVDRFSTSVFFPEEAQKRGLIGNLSLYPPVFTPNGDGVGDELEVRFTVLKVDVPAQVKVYSLSGELVDQVTGERQPDGFWGFNWSGLDQSGKRVLPGIYLCHISLDSQAGDEDMIRIINVAY